jgi:hypothetical protein
MIYNLNKYGSKEVKCLLDRDWQSNYETTEMSRENGEFNDELFDYLNNYFTKEEEKPMIAILKNTLEKAEQGDIKLPSTYMEMNSFEQAWERLKASLGVY